MNWMPQAIRDGIIVVLVISGPLVLAAAFIGLVIGVLQAATQVQEQTIGSALKIIGVFVLIISLGFWMFQYLNQYTTKTLSSAFTFIPRQSQKVIPTGVSTKGEFKEGFEKVPNVEKIENEVLEIPQGIPYLGSPEIVKPPPISKPSLPSVQTVPQIPKVLTVPIAPLKGALPIEAPIIQPQPQTQIESQLQVQEPQTQVETLPPPLPPPVEARPPQTEIPLQDSTVTNTEPQQVEEENIESQETKNEQTERANWLE
ncbi:MAG: flagellar biosynthetic protein FliQ [Candidatus Melainabacteria bacterium]|nr:flagellar biosynthetic protein FliQ [Candidatus Melainabacteria bacterium]